MSVDLKAALLSIQTRPSLTKEDRAHIKRWLAVASDPIWQKIITEFEASGELPNFKDGLPGFVVDRALRYRRYAENAEYETAEIRMQRERQRLERREQFLSLASDIEDAVARLRNYRDEWFPPAPFPNSPSELETQRSLEWLERQIKDLRRRAEPSDSMWSDIIKLTVSRQSGGRGKHARSRALGLFIRKMVNFMYSVCNRPRYEYVARLTSVAFRDADIGAEEVRQNCRRYRTGTLRR
jgi:hypothetical protein